MHFNSVMKHDKLTYFMLSLDRKLYHKFSRVFRDEYERRWGFLSTSELKKNIAMLCVSQKSPPFEFERQRCTGHIVWTIV